MRQSKKRGITIIEILLYVGMSAVMVVGGFLALTSFKSKQELSSATKKLTSLLREAQSRSMNGRDGTMWGVRLVNSTSSPDSFMIVKYPYSVTSTLESFTSLPSNIQLSESSLVSGTSTVYWFTQISGTPVSTGTIILELTSGSSEGGSGITRDSSGLIFFDNFNRSSL
jgi:type II secretory pathway pseudopilin PulG